jgi:hypothetical protein
VRPGRLAAALAVAALAAAGAGCGSDEAAVARTGAPVTTAAADAPAGLVWKGAPSVFTPDQLPRDKILTGTLRNATGGPVDLRVDRVDVKGSDGRSLGANVRFVSTFGHGLYGPGGPPAPLRASRYDQARLGERLTLPANADRAITVAWRVPEGRKGAAAVEVSGYTLELP